MPRFTKQLIIGGVYVVIIAGIFFLYYQAHYAPSCHDGKQNGQEEGIDCGTIACGVACASPVQPVQVQSSQLIKTAAGDHDFVAQLYNPNTDYGVASGVYELTLNGQTSSHDFYMLPGQTKYVVLTSLKSLPDGTSAQPVIKDIQWEKVSGDPAVQFNFTNENYTTIGNQATYEATLTNSSNFDFDSVDIIAIVTASDGSVVATNTSVVQTFLSQESRYVKMTWPFPLPADARVQVQASTNVFNNDNFLKAHGAQEKFQQLY